MKRTLYFAVLVVLLLPSCGGTDRPEGVVERWLVSLNQGKAGQPEKYAPDELSQQILPNWQERDPGALDVIEVGTGGRVVPEGGVPPAEKRYLVPYRVTRLNGRELRGTAELFSVRGGPWRVDHLLGRDPALRVPSEGGKRIGHASMGVWLAGAGIAALLILVSIALMSTVGRKARVSA